MTANVHQFEYDDTEPATWGAHGGDPEVPAHYKCACGHEVYSGDPEAEERGARAEHDFQLQREMKCGL